MEGRTVEDKLKAPKVWTSLLTNVKYLKGLLTLDHALKKYNSKYPLVVLYTDAFEQEGHEALDRRGIPKKRIEYLLPTLHKDYSNDARFYDCWSKLSPFSLVEYERVVQLDSDMLVLRNMDELMDVELDPVSMNGSGRRVMAASHACVCNPLKRPHYPGDWIPANCAFTAQHSDPKRAQSEGASATTGLGLLNGGLQVVVPSKTYYDLIIKRLGEETSIASYDFADQSLLSDIFSGNWVPLPYIYNALKTLRWEGVHSEIWQDEKVKNVHYILTPKPWDVKRGEEKPEDKIVFGWWYDANDDRLRAEKARGIDDGF